MWWLLLLACTDQGTEGAARFDTGLGAWRVGSAQVGVRVGDQGFVVEPRGRDDGWTATFSLADVGGVVLPPVDVAAARSVGDRLTVDRGAGVEEWFVDTDAGVEHGFTLAAHPSRTGLVSLVLAIDTGTRVGSSSVQVLDDDGAVAFVYDQLAVWDAAERPLAARFVDDGCAEAGCQLRIEVDTEGATWPITVDPLIHQAMQTINDFQAPGFGGYALSSDREWLAIGVAGAAPNSRGYVSIRRRNSGGRDVWGEYTTVSSDSNDRFGAAVAFDFPWLAVGAPTSDTVYLYEYDVEDVDGDGYGFELLRTFTGTGGCGTSVSLRGRRLAMGCPDEDKVVVFDAQDSLSAPLTEEIVLAGGPAGFGTDVALTSSHLAVGAPQALGGEGAVYVYARGAAGTLQHVLETTLQAPGPQVGELYGQALTLSSTYLMVGTPQRGEGRVYVYRNDGTWSLETELESPPGGSGWFGIDLAHFGPFLTVLGVAGGNAVAHHYEDTSGVPERWGYVDSAAFGTSTQSAPLAVSAGGRFAALGAPETPGGVAGLVEVDDRVFEDFAITPAPIPGIEPGWDLGAAVAIDGDLAVVGAPEYPGDGTDRGRVYVFRRDGSSWTRLNPSLTGGTGAAYGTALALHDGVLAVGSPTLRGDGGVDLYRFDGTEFLKVDEITSAGGGLNANFGLFVSLTSDHLLVQADGVAYIYRNDGIDSWTNPSLLRSRIEIL